MTIRYYHNSFYKKLQKRKEGSSYWRDDMSPHMYWTTDGMSLVRFDGMQEIKPIEFDTLRKVRVYVNGDTLPFKQ